MQRLTAQELAARAQKMCRIEGAIEDADRELEVAKKEHKATVEALRSQVAKLRREIETGEADVEQLELPTVEEALDHAADQAEPIEAADSPRWLLPDTTDARQELEDSRMMEAAETQAEIEAALSDEGEELPEQDELDEAFDRGFQAFEAGESKLSWKREWSPDYRRAWLEGWTDAEADQGPLDATEQEG